VWDTSTRSAAGRSRDASGASPGNATPVLLAVADYNGTLAAARCLGRAGVPVVLAERRLLVPARWSRFVSRRLAAPGIDPDPERFLEWLLAFGAREPGLVLLATSDDLAWLLARHRDALARVFRLDLPPLDAVHALLDKWRLREACAAVGLEVPESWLPEREGDLAQIACEARFPLVIKPRTQVFLTLHHKGHVVRSPDALAPMYARFCAGARYAPMLLAHDPGLARPMVQAFHGTPRGVYGVSGFVDRTGELFVVTAARKVLQRPRGIGVGLCFEEEEVVPELARKVAALCRRVGYHGVFEAEFIEAGGRHLLIDFNPRFYGQMAFDIARGVELPRLAYLAALGGGAALHAAVEDARRSAERLGRRVYCSTLQLAIFLRLLRITGRMSRDDARGWQRWLDDHRGHVTDAIASPGDPGPGIAEVVSSAIHCVLHPRSALRAAQED
jgi:D-aspartate ligase